MPRGVGDGLDDALRLFDALVGYHRNRVGQLHDVHRVPLTEQHGVAGSPVPAIRGVQHAFGFAWQVQSCGLSDTEFADEVVPLLVGHLVSGNDHANVRRLFEDAGERPMFVAMVHRVLIGLSFHGHRVRYREFVIDLVQSQLQHARHGQHLADGARFEGLAHRPGGAHLRLVASGLGRIAVRQSEDVARLHVLDHGDAPSGMVFVFAVAQHFLGVPLHIPVDGEGDVGSVDRVFGFGHGSGDFDAAVALLVHLVAVTARQCLVFHLLDAGHALAVGVDTTQ